MQTRLFATASLLLVASWITRSFLLYRDTGLFGFWLGVDYGYYFALVQALWTHNPLELYDRASLDKFHALLSVYSLQPLPGGQTPYAPLFAWLFSPFVLLSPPLGFAAWTALNLGAGCYLAWRVAGAFPIAARRWVCLLIVTSLPFGMDLVFGQSMMLLACALTEFYLSLKAGKDIRAGLWLSLLLFKPQYLFLLVPLLVWKRQRNILLMLGVGVVILVIGSVLVAGVPALLEYPRAILEEGGDFGGAVSATEPQSMINWRSLVLRLPFQMDDAPAVLVTAMLSLATVAVTFLAWRGPIDTGSRAFSAKFLLMVVATLLASYHSHLPGAVLLATPAMGLLGAPGLASRGRALIAVGSILLTLRFTVGGFLAPHIMVLMLVVMFGALLHVIRSEKRGLKPVRLLVTQQASSTSIDLLPVHRRRILSQVTELTSTNVARSSR